MRSSFVFVFVLLVGKSIIPQSNVNPDISAIGSFNTAMDFNKESEDYGKFMFEEPSVELFFEGYLNPYSSAVVNIAFEEGELGVEELYASILQGLPLDIQLKAGKYLIGLGKLNTFHPHTWQFINRPLFQQVYFGEEGFNDIGASLNFIIPTENFFSSVELGVYKGDGIGRTEAADPGSQESIKELRGTNPIFAGRLNTFFDIGDFNNLELGLSGSYGVHSKSSYYYLLNGVTNGEDKNLSYTYLLFDFKYKYRPDSYTSFTVHGEAILNNREIITIYTGDDVFSPNFETITTTGAFLYLDYQFDKQFSIGAKYDFTYGIPGDEPGESSLANDKDNKTHGIEGWFGYYPVEETLGVRLGIQQLVYDFKNNTRDSDTKAELQLIFSLGPHKAHPF